MLTESQREALSARLRQGRTVGAGEIPRRDPAMMTPQASFGQEQLWFIDRFAPGLPTYNIPLALRISGPLDHPALERAVGELVGRHEALRTRLVSATTGRPVQVIDPGPPPAPVAPDLMDLSGFETGKRDARLRELIDDAAVRPFDLAAGPLFRALLARLASDAHVLVAVFHHTVFDGWSAGVFVRDLAALYQSAVTGEAPALPELPVQFADYALWERQRLQGTVLTELESYWRQALDGFETVQFPTDRPRPPVDNFAGALAELRTDATLLAGLRQVSRQEGTTLFATLMTALLALLHRYTGQDDLVVGTVSANRGRAELAPLIGFLVNTLPIRADVSGDPEFTCLLARVKETTLGAYAHQDLPFGKLVETVGVERDASRAPVFQIAMTYAERDETPVSAAGVEFAASDLVTGIDAAKFDLTFATEARHDGLWVECSYKTALFDQVTIGRLLGNYEVLLRGVVADPSARLSQLPLLTDAELRAELVEWNDTAAPVPPGCVHELFQQQVSRTPDAPAAEHEGQQISYAELNRQANQIARRLRALGTGPDALVGICMTTGLRRLAALLGVMKAGGGYVPLDPGLPPERLKLMIADTAMSTILTDTLNQPHILDTTRTGTAVVCLDTGWEQLSRLSDSNLEGTGVTPSNVAYVIYTSGSTGQPKGVVVEHRNMVNFLHGTIGLWGIGPHDTVLQLASISFDASVIDTFMPLLGGAKVELAPAGTLHSPARLAALIRDAKITFAFVPPALLGLLPVGDYPDLRILTTGAEELPPQVARRWMRPGLRLVNAYGPTEATVIATCAELDTTSAMPPPIGFPAPPNCRVYVLDRELNPVPAGVTGELHVGGAGVARGYLNRPDLTAERFIPDPFAAGQRLYKTGDLVRRRSDGSIVFLGRSDGQVKIRGLRVELGEIEAALATHPAIAQAVVTVLTGAAPALNGDKELAAYLRPVPGGAISEQDLRVHLARNLPAWMIPAHFTTVDDFPLNGSGKIDKTALQTPGQQRLTTLDHVPPATLIETILADIYAGLLGTDRVGATDSFFDLGGNSLTAIRLVSMLDEELNVDVGAAAMFLAPTPRLLAALLRDEHGLEDEELGAGGLGDLAP